MSEVRVYDTPSDLAGRWVRETDMTALRAENARLREVLEAIADGPGTNGYCTQYERYMVELAQAALQPERGKP